MRQSISLFDNNDDDDDDDDDGDDNGDDNHDDDGDDDGDDDDDNNTNYTTEGTVESTKLFYSIIRSHKRMLLICKSCCDRNDCNRILSQNTLFTSTLLCADLHWLKAAWE